MNNSQFSRRGVLKAASIALAAGTVGVGGATVAQAQTRKKLGTVIDYSARVPSGASVRAAGHLGAIRYVSQPRPDAASWMKGKPVKLAETKDFAANGLFTASVYQYGREGTADWKQGAAGAATHAPQAIALHKAAGGPKNRPIYIAIDDNPTRKQYTDLIRPYLQAFQAALKAAGYQTGVYGNWNTVEWCIQDGTGEFFWQHNWGSNGKLHSRATLHQVSINSATVGSVKVDINDVYAADWGQWQPGKAPSDAVSIPLPDQAQLEQMSAVASDLSSNVNQQDIQNAVKAAQQFLN